MRQKLVPKKVGEGGREAVEDAEEVSFEGADGTFGGIAAMDSRGHQLKIDVLFLQVFL